MEYPPVRTWYCQSCSTEIRRRELEGEVCRTCGGKRFSIQPKPHTFDKWELSDEDRAFLLVQRIDPWT